MNKYTTISIATAALVLLGAGCGSSTPPVEDSTDSPSAAALAPDVDPSTVDEMVVEENSADEPAAVRELPPKAPAGQEAQPANQRQNQPSAPEEESNPSAAEAPPEVKSFTITATQWDFTPSTITVNQGDTVRLTVTSADVSHGIFLKAFGINQVLPPNETKVIEFVADNKGTFPFVCSVQCGAGHGSMTGQLIVK